MFDKVMANMPSEKFLGFYRGKGDPYTFCRD